MRLGLIRCQGVRPDWRWLSEVQVRIRGCSCLGLGPLNPPSDGVDPSTASGYILAILRHEMILTPEAIATRVSFTSDITRMTRKLATGGPSVSNDNAFVTDLTLDQEYLINAAERILTPALAVYPDIVDFNISATLRLLSDDADRWRPHIKTAKLAYTLRRFLAHGIHNVKCSTTLELRTACENGVRDALVSYPLVGAGARRVLEIAAQFPQIRISALVENEQQIDSWRGGPVGLFIDVNPGMDRTGVEQGQTDVIVKLARRIGGSGVAFRGLHYYDGHLSSGSMGEREATAHSGYDRLMQIVAALERTGLPVEEVITAGTPAFPCSLTYRGFEGASFIHRVSPGTIVYCDATSLGQLEGKFGYRPAAVVLSTVVSHPTRNRITCDAGHKTVSADAGIPTCVVLGRPDLAPRKPSEEHLPIDVREEAPHPEIGEVLYLVPRHICPTVNNFDHALLVVGGRIQGVERVTARGREAPLHEWS